MTDIFREKAKQVPIFRHDLLSSYPRKIAHNLPDKKWASTHILRNGELFKGQDLFATLLMQVRLELLVETGYFGTPPSPTSPPKPKASKAQQSPTSSRGLSPSPSTSSSTPPSTPISTTPSALPTSNRFTPLQVNDLDFPQLPKPSTPFCTPPPRCTRSRPNISYYHPISSNRGKTKTKWVTPSCSSKVVFIGDSNLNRISQKPKTPVESIEIHSFSGAKTRHFHKTICQKTSVPQKTPDHVVLSVGINDRDNSPNTHKDQMPKTIRMVTRVFPNAQLYIPLINYSSSLERKHRDSLDYLNKLIEELAGSFPNVRVIPKLDPSLFLTQDDDAIHWLPKTANALQEHWLSHLN